MRVANDAVRIVQRFHRDWMTPGRRPAGVCGAALILAARMNNFRRTTREMVYVAKVSEATIQKRLDEFKVTESSNLTVDEFRNIDLEQSCDPPAFYEQKEGKKKTRKRRRVQIEDDGDSGPESHNATAAASTDPVRAADSESQQADIDRLRMPPPPIPIDPALIQPSAQVLAESQVPSSSEQNLAVSKDGVSSPARKRQKRNTASGQNTARTSPQALGATSPQNQATKSVEPSARTRKTPVSETPLLERDITSLLSPPTTYDSAAAFQRALEATSDSAPEVPKPRRLISDSEIISEEEFASDPEVMDCVLSLAEFAIKERIWTHDNRDYLRAQQNKLMKQQLAEANGTARPVLKRKRKRGRMGDMSAYRDGDDEDGQIASSPAEAAMKMLKRRGFSKKINYEMLKEIYEPSTASSSGSTPEGGSRRPSEANIGTPTTPTIEVPTGTIKAGRTAPESETDDATADMDPTGHMRAPGPNLDDEDESADRTDAVAEEVMDEDDGGDWNESDLEDAGGAAPYEDDYEGDGDGDGFGEDFEGDDYDD